MIFSSIRFLFCRSFIIIVHHHHHLRPSRRSAQSSDREILYIDFFHHSREFHRRIRSNLRRDTHAHKTRILYTRELGITALAASFFFTLIYSRSVRGVFFFFFFWVRGFDGIWSGLGIGWSVNGTVNSHSMGW
ncbi:hypothetical protein F4781DRAFT_342510 [Annulohypoxylon bovei var. microspora]|nr:hypothetical protein F4781DRAFT_342510 [Annulohypoxylon bovei var. microspora]